jgi:glucosamine-phosphate N-acetyltransferase
MPLDTYRHFVVVDTADHNSIVGAGTLFIELKFIHACGRVGHVEDVVVAERCRGRALGKVVVEALVEEAKRAGCYKIILDCAEKNVQFYERCGFSKKELQMVIYF